MNTNEFAQTLLTWIKTLLLWIGIPHPILNKLDEIIFLVFIIIIAFAIGTAMHYITLYFTRRILMDKVTTKKWNAESYSDRIELQGF